MALEQFTQFALGNISIDNPTSLEFGPDGRLYVCEQDGTILALTIEAQTDAEGFRTGYTVTGVDQIDIVQTIPNHDDFGNYQPAAAEGRSPASR